MPRAFRSALIIPATSVPVERVFPAASQVYDKRRQNLGRSLLNIYLFNKELAPSHKKGRFIKRCELAGRGYRLGLGARGRGYRHIPGHGAERQRLRLFITCIYIQFFLYYFVAFPSSFHLFKHFNYVISF